VGHQKFDQLSRGRYLDKYFKNDTDFYKSIQNHVLKHIPKDNTIGIDIGAGPGIGARIFANLGFNTRLYGFEPSRTSSDGVKLSKELHDTKNPVQYFSEKCGITKINSPKPDTLDYILVLRASHEIAESIGSKDKFFKELSRIINGLKKKGFLIIAEPEYYREQVSDVIIKKVQEYQMKNIGHCHVPSDYIASGEMKKIIQNIGLKLIDESILPDGKLLIFLQAQGYNLIKSPCSFYVHTYQKQ